MTARRRTALTLLLALCLTMIPARSLVSAAGEVDPSYVPILHLSGEQALIDGNWLYAAQADGLYCYDLTTSQLITKIRDGNGGRALTMLDHLYEINDRGDLLTYDMGPQGLELIGRVRIQGNPGSSNRWEQGPLARLDDQRLITMTQGDIYVFDQQTGVTEWKYETDFSHTTNEFVLLGNYVFMPSQSGLTPGYLTGVEIGKQKVFGSETRARLLPVVDNASAEPSLYYLSDRETITRLHVDAQGNMVTEPWLKSQYQPGEVGNLSVHAGKLYYFDNNQLLSCDLVTKTIQHYQAKASGLPQWLSEDSDVYRTDGGGVTEVRSDRVTFGTSMPEGSFGDLVASTEAGFVLRAIDNGGLWVYAKADQIMPTRELSFGQSHLIVLQHEQAGPISFNLSLTMNNPKLLADVRFLQFDAPNQNWDVVDSNQVTDGPGYSKYQANMPAGPLMVMITANSLDERYDASYLARYPDWAAPLSYQLTYGLGVEPEVGEIPNLKISSPAPRLDLWGDDSLTTSATVNLQTDPDTWVYFLNGKSAAQADANGDITQVLPLGSGLISGIQAMAGTGPNSAMVTVPVYRHWVLQKPGEAAWLNRFPAVELKVPDVSKVDLQDSRLEANGIPFQLYADLKTNRLYGLSIFPLRTGQLRFTLVLASKETPGSSPFLLDAFGWDQEVVGDRTAELWPGKLAATLNGTSRPLDAAPYLRSTSAGSITMLPFRFIGDVMGAQVNWDGAKKQVTFKLENTVVLTIGSRTAKVNGKSVTMATAPTMINNRTMVPLRFVSENLGAKVDWDGKQHKVTIKVAARPVE